MSILSAISDRIKLLAVDIGKTEPAQKSSIEEHIDLCINQHQTFLTTVELLGAEQRQKLTAMIEEQLKLDTSGQWTKLYKQILGSLPQAVRTLEVKSAFSAIVISNMRFSEMLTKLSDQFDTLFPDPAVTVQNMNVTQTMVMGFLRASDQLSGCSIALWNGMLEEILKTQANPARYLYERVESALPQLIESINMCHSGSEVLTFDKVMERFKREGKDTFLVNSDNTPNTAFMHGSSTDPANNPFFRRGLMTFNPLIWVQQFWILHRNLRIRKLEAEAQWLHTQVELLKLKMQGVSPDSPAYRNLEHTIERYNTVVARFEADIARYRKGE